MDPRYLVVYLGWERKRYWLSGWSWTNRMGFHGISLAMESINFMGFRKERDTFWILLTHHSSRWNPCFHREKTWPRNWNPRKELEVSKFELGVIFSSHPFRTMGFFPWNKPSIFGPYGPWLYGNPPAFPDATWSLQHTSTTTILASRGAEPMTDP